MNILAIDLSLTRTGWCDGADAGVLVPPKGRDRGLLRLQWIRDMVLMLAGTAGAQLVVLEGYSMGQARGSSHSHALGELGGVVRLALFEADIPFVDVAPASLKKYATGKGNAGKELVLVEAVKRLAYPGSDNNEADALWLYTMARDAYGLAEPVVPKANREGLTKVNWPELNITAGV